MQIQLGDQVYSSDDKDVGKVDKLILDPASGEIRSAVVHKGLLLSHDVEVPIEAFTTRDGDTARLCYTKDQVDALPAFQEDNYVQPPTGFVPPYGYPSPGLLFPAAWVQGSPLPASPAYYDPPAVDERQYEVARRQELQQAIVQEGSQVRSRDGEKVGKVKSITVDTDTGRPTSFVIEKGFLLTDDLELPTDAIDSAVDDEVILTLDKAQVESYRTART